MKHGSEYAQEVKRLYRRLLKQASKPEIPAPLAPIEQLVVGILSACTTDHKAIAVYRKLRDQTVDLNELRVTPPIELAEMIGNGVPLAREKAHRIVDALNAVRRRQDKLDLSFLQQRARREARDYLESLEGVDKATAASVVLFSLGGHAVPVDELMLYVLRQEEMVEPTADVAEVQAFLERTIPAEETAVFSLLLARYVAQKGVRVPAEKLRELLAPPAPPPAAPAESVPANKPAVTPSPAPGKDGKLTGQAPVEKAGKPAPVTSKPPAPTTPKPPVSTAAKPVVAAANPKSAGTHGTKPTAAVARKAAPEEAAAKTKKK